jgi:acyl-CoA thioester hydrolase
LGLDRNEFLKVDYTSGRWWFSGLGKGKHSNTNQIPPRAYHGYNFNMTDFRFYVPIEVRYGDLDTQGHVNNAKYMTYLEHARLAYLAQLGLWNDHLFVDTGIMLADAHLTFKAPIRLRQSIQIGVRTTRLGNKSMEMVYLVEDTQSGQELATASTILVIYDLQTSQSIPIPNEWRQAISNFEQFT